MKTKRLIAVGIFAAMTFSACSKGGGGKDSTPPPSGNTDGLHIVDSKYLADGAGNKVVLRGVNMGCAYSDGFGAAEIKEIEKTGANSVRLVLQRQYNNSNQGPMTAAIIEPLITLCIDKGMIPVLDLQDFTAEGPTPDVGGSINQALQWWTSSDIKNMLMKYQKSIIINIANEPADDQIDYNNYTSINANAIKTLRNAGFSCPLMIDAPGFGHDPNYFVQAGQGLISGDPLHNIIFSIHTYWPSGGPSGSYSDQQISTFLNGLGNTGLPVTAGEIAAMNDDGPSDPNDPDNPAKRNYSYINYRWIMQLCQQNQMGYMVWWWGFTDQYNSPETMTTDGTYAGLAGAGSVFATTDPNSIKNTSVRASNLK